MLHVRSLVQTWPTQYRDKVARSARGSFRRSCRGSRQADARRTGGRPCTSDFPGCRRWSSRLLVAYALKLRAAESRLRARDAFELPGCDERLVDDATCAVRASESDDPGPRAPC